MLLARHQSLIYHFRGIVPPRLDVHAFLDDGVGARAKRLAGLVAAGLDLGLRWLLGVAGCGGAGGAGGPDGAVFGVFEGAHGAEDGGLRRGRSGADGGRRGSGGGVAVELITIEARLVSGRMVVLCFELDKQASVNVSFDSLKEGGGRRKVYINSQIQSDIASREDWTRL